MQFRQATERDISALARLNRQLIEDEGHRNRMTLPELETRMRQWLQGSYEAILFVQQDQTVAYALYRHDPDAIYLRQFFVDRQHRRTGVGRQAMQMLLTEIWPADQRIRLEVLAHNQRGMAFWRAIGFQEYAITFELDR